MPRPISWLPRLEPIRRSLENSVRSHLDRRFLERLFELQPRSAQLLMDTLPTIAVGRSRLVEREVLLTLLAEVARSEDPSTTLETARAERNRPRRTLRSMLPHDHPPASWDRLPANLSLAPGKLTIEYTRLEELVLTLLELSSLLDTQLEEFAERFEPKADLDLRVAHVRQEVEEMFLEFQAIESP